ncbi:N-acetyltransferase [bacterium]|nr:N-acetyltransferase [bacterium]
MKLPVRFSPLSQQNAIEYPSISKTLDRAFAVEKYIESFPHIFSRESSARLCIAEDSNNEVVGLCAIDSEHWSFPRMLRGACIGSVAVDPRMQGHGIGRALIRWVVDRIRDEKAHDFVYLFSDKPSFYEALGFSIAGEERICALEPGISQRPVQSGYHLAGPRAISELNEAQLSQLWSALEKCRLPGESHANLSKLRLVARIPNMQIIWIEEGSRRILAGAFLGKGVDFQGVLHTFFAESAQAANDFLGIFYKSFHVLAGQLQVAAGLWTPQLATSLKVKHIQPLCLVLGLEEETSGIQHALGCGEIYPRGVFSS